MPSPMLKYRGSNLVRAGFMGVALIIMVILIGLQPEKLLSLATNVKYQALFSEAGGIMPGSNPPPWIIPPVSANVSEELNKLSTLPTSVTEPSAFNRRPA